MGVLSGYKPESIFRFFEEISEIPRSSGHEQEISEYLINFAIRKGLDYYCDNNYNVLIKKPGTFGLENASPVIIQGHTDMVCEKNAGVVHDFLKDPLKLYVEDGYIKARNTTLGGDNGVAVAYALAVLDSDTLRHPPIEALFTADEEQGLIGAIAFDCSRLSGKTLINLDSGEEGKVLVSCAGGMRHEMRLGINWIMSWVLPMDDSISYKIIVNGLKGGHSGADIHKERGNAIKLMGRALHHLSKKIAYCLNNISGGEKENAIPRESQAIITISKKDEDILKNEIDFLHNTFASELRSIERNISVTCEQNKEETLKVFSEETKSKAISIIMLTPNGTQAWSKEIVGLVETSNNLGVLKTHDDSLIFINSVRSCVRSKKEYMKNMLDELAAALSVKAETRGDYPEWEYNPDSVIRGVFHQTYRDMFGKDMKEEAYHAGLECGVFSDRIKGVDVVSFGPDLYDIHTPDERLSVESYIRMWEYLTEILSRLNY